MPKTLPEIEKRAEEMIDSWDDLLYYQKESLKKFAHDFLTQSFHAGEESTKDIACKFVQSYEEKYKGCGMGDSLLALRELLEALLSNKK
jgi:hypothetical protein